jgi:hypothetical protein
MQLRCRARCTITYWNIVGAIQLRKLDVEIVKIAEASAEKEVLADVAKGALDFALILHGSSGASMSLPS